MFVPLLAFALSDAPYAPLRDHALIELGLRRLAEGQPPEVGVYSRFGWYHPGPALYYVLSVPYLLVGQRSIALPIGALAVNAACLLSVAYLVRRHRGLVSALWALLVCLVFLRQLEDGILVDAWNPYLPVLPFLVAVLLCWAALHGDRWALPVAVVVLSVCVQAHVGYALPACALIFVTAALLVWMRLRGRGALPTIRAALIAGVALTLMWLPPVWQQFTGTEGNLSALLRDLADGASPGQSLGAAARLVGTELGRLPAFASGITPEPAYLAPPRLPIWTGVGAVAVLVVLCIVAARRRDRSSVLLGLFTVLVTLAAVFAVTHVRGLLFGYLVQWATVAGILLWLTAGLVLIDVGQAGVQQEHGVARKPRSLVTVGLCVALLWVTALVITGNTKLPENDPDSSRLAEAVSKWLPNRADVVDVSYLGTVRPTLVGATGEGAAFVLQLDRRHVRVQAPTAPELGFGPVHPHVSGPVRFTVQIGLVGNSLPPPPGFTEIARTYTLVAYGAPSAGPR